MTSSSLFTVAFVALSLLFIAPMNAQNHAAALTSRQQALATISAYTATGNQAHLRDALVQGLAAGLTINEEKEVLAQLYAYCGFPRSLYGLTTLMKLLEERQAQGIRDVAGKEASPVASLETRYERGRKNLEKLTGQPEANPKTGINAFSPEIDGFLKEHLFADIFERDVLTFQEREIVTISALVSQGGVEPMLQSHIGMGMHVGLTEGQVRQIIDLDEAAAGKPVADAARTVLTKSLAVKAQK